MRLVSLGSPPQYIKNWIKDHEEIDYLKIPFCIEALEDGNVKLVKTGSPQEISLIYSLDNKNWEDWDYSTGTNLKQGQKLYLKSKIDSDYFSTDYDNYFQFNFSQKVNVCGNIMSLLFEEYADTKEFKTSNPFICLFYKCTSLIDASNLKLPATKLNYNCYNMMFRGCEGLMSTPELPATTLEPGCYTQMFYGCTSLTTTPKLPATTLDYLCYYGMFKDCTNLSSVLYLPATSLPWITYDIPMGCYETMFSNCLNIPEIHYPVSIENNSTFKSMDGTPWFGATNATIYYDL